VCGQWRKPKVTTCSICGDPAVMSDNGYSSGYCRQCNSDRNKEFIASKGPEYRVWRSMIKRCEQRKRPEYPRYGGRGVSVCQSWRKSFDIFLTDMGRRPSAQHQIDRIDNDGNYEPSNCRWATQVQNMRNSTVTKMTPRTVVLLRCERERNGATYEELAKKFGIGRQQAWNIVNRKAWNDIQ